MATYGKYFSAAELKLIFENWKPIEAEWLPLMAQVRQAMDSGLAIDSPEVQPLANRWMTLMIHWMDGDFDLMERWGRMFRQEPSAHGRNNAPPGDMIDYITQVIDVRMALMANYLDPADMRRIGAVLPAQWRALEAAVTELIDTRATVGSPAAQAAIALWRGLMDRLTGNDPVVRGKLMAAWAQEPLLRAGSSLSPPVRAWLAEAAAQKSP